MINNRILCDLIEFQQIHCDLLSIDLNTCTDQSTVDCAQSSSDNGTLFALGNLSEERIASIFVENSRAFHSNDFFISAQVNRAIVYRDYVIMRYKPHFYHFYAMQGVSVRSNFKIILASVPFKMATTKKTMIILLGLILNIVSDV